MSGHGLDLCQGDLDVLAVEWLHALGQGQQLVRVDLEKTNNELYRIGIKYEFKLVATISIKQE